MDAYCICCGAKIKSKAKEPACKRCKDAWASTLKQSKKIPGCIARKNKDAVLETA
ncbi:MAG: hypothetical protein KAJ62_11700 [Desulfobacteraceae bacterium]|nr:hypothetical protein [Desulfobacteraceae bacterium]